MTWEPDSRRIFSVTNGISQGTSPALISAFTTSRFPPSDAPIKAVEPNLDPGDLPLPIEYNKPFYYETDTLCSSAAYCLLSLVNRVSTVPKAAYRNYSGDPHWHLCRMTRFVVSEVRKARVVGLSKDHHCLSWV